MVNSENAITYIKNNLLQLISDGKLIADTEQSVDTISFYVYKTPTERVPLLTLRTSDHRPTFQKYINSKFPYPSEEENTNLSIEFYKQKTDENGKKVRNRVNHSVTIPKGVEAPSPFIISSFSYKPELLDENDVETIYQSVLDWIFSEDRSSFLDPFKGTEKEASEITKESRIKNKNIKTENYMRNNKRTIRLTESDLHRVIKESVKRMIREHWTDEEGNHIRHQNAMTEELLNGLADEKLNEVMQYIHEGDYEYAYGLMGKFMSDFVSWVNSCPTANPIR